MSPEPAGARFAPLPPERLGGTVDRLLVLMPDQLHDVYLRAAGLDRAADAVLQMEVTKDFEHVPSHKQRTALILSAMRHFGRDLSSRGWRCAYLTLGDSEADGGFASRLQRACRALRPERLVAFRPGDFRTLDALEAAVAELRLPLDLLEDPHFLLQPSEFDDWASNRKTLVMEHFYRWMRRRLGILISDDGQPEGGSWNYDAANRRQLGKDAPAIPDRLELPPDAITREVLEEVQSRFPDAPGRLETFAWPVTRQDALKALDDFVRNRLPCFGDYQDAMQSGAPWLFHSLLAPALNLKLLEPLECVDAAVEAYRAGEAPLNAVEGFVRQIIGWREFIRGIYWREGPDYVRRNHLEQHGRLPHFYWSGESDLRCVDESVGQVLEHGYGHHIQRLMVTGNLALIAGVDPAEVNDWYLGMYVDAMDWVTLPNVVGMVMFADGGVVASKPYAASGRYIDRMSDYCGGCRFDPGQRTGDDACPITTLYWEFLDRNRQRLHAVPRMRLSLNNLHRLDEAEIQQVRSRAKALRTSWGIST